MKFTTASQSNGVIVQAQHTILYFSGGEQKKIRMLIVVTKIY
jgi:hypothetical protein